MGILNKYIFRQVAISALMTVALFVFVLVLGNVLKQVMGELTAGRMSLSLFAYILALLIPSVIPYAMPMGMLTGILLVFGRLSSQSEIVAMKACGRSLYSMAAPVFLVAICASLFSVAINFYYAPAASNAYKGALRNIVRHSPLDFIEAGTFIKDFPKYVIYANGSNDSELEGFRIIELDKNSKAIVSIYAQTATVTYDDDTDEIVLTLKNGSAEQSKASDPEDLRKPLPSAYFEEFVVKLPLNEILGESSSKATRLKHMTFGELMHARDNWHPRPESQNTPELIYRDRIEVQLQIQKNFAMAFSIFSMVVLAIPLGIKASRSETFANLAIAVALAMTYYMCTVVISYLEKYPTLRPDILIWIPNLLFQGVGAFLIWRASKH